MMKGLVWLRRDLRLYDHQPLAAATQECEQVYLLFIFDPNILINFPDKKDRRLTFIVNALEEVNRDLKPYEANVIIAHGIPEKVIPVIANELNIDAIYAGRDYEPNNITRDKNIKKLVSNLGIKFNLYCDHLLIPVDQILKDNGEPYKVFTSYSKAWRARIRAVDYQEYQVNLTKLTKAKIKNYPVIDGPTEQVIASIGYQYIKEDLWEVRNPREKLAAFGHKINDYKINRDFVNKEGTSKLSPYLRFGLLSIRDCYRKARDYDSSGSYAWINELIWREFYNMILYHFPESIKLDFQPQYRNLRWQNNEIYIKAWKQGETGYPIIDAAMRQLLTTGWMHNRARMIVASFLTKDLLVDWRIGEQHFAQYLMDYELSSNVGGWQWAASTGTDAQPYFRVFNPYLQSQKFDPNGEYIRAYVDELKDCGDKNIHQPSPAMIKYYNYNVPIIDHNIQRIKAINMFKLNKV